MATPAPAGNALSDLAVRIYIELIGQTVVVTDKAAQVRCNPENLAKISFKLAEAFQRAEAEQNEASAPKNQGFDIDASDLSTWNKPS